ncbi:MAG: DUF58 domain-containing protein [Planctomycetes bacterium]|nr:DUF58 domain-containing protein [Planctomycetota bacterium]
MNTDSLADYTSLLSPDTMAKIHRLELVARGVVEGFVSGRHRSPYKGFSVEFAEHRQYCPGDDIRDLDWRVWGKSDRYYVKQYIDETNLRAAILLDASGSMAYTGTAAAAQDGRAASKFNYGRLTAAAMAHLLITQQDAVGLATFDSKVRRYIPSRSRAGHLRVILQELADTRPGSDTGVAAILHDMAERLHRRSLVVILSDLFDDPAEILKALQHLRFRRHEVLVFHVLADEELSFPFERISSFRDLELDERRLQLDPRAIRRAYLRQVADFLGQIQQGCGQMSIDYVPMPTSRPFDEALAEYLAQRAGKARPRAPA